MVQLFNPNLTPKSVTPEGHTGADAFMFLPFYAYGYWSPSGRQLTFLTGELKQKSSRVLNGISRPDVFRKDASSCPTPLV